MAEPLLDLGDVGLVVESVGGGRGPQRVGADLEAEGGGVAPHDLVDRIGGEARCLVAPSAQRPE